MFLVGHVAFGYVSVRVTSRALKVDIPIFMALLAGIIPDFDFLFGWSGLGHHMVTHSIIFWIPLAMVFLILWGRKAIPPLVGIILHLVGDFLTSVPLFLPISDIEIGFGVGLLTPVDAVAEIGGLILMLSYMLVNGDLHKMTVPSRRNLWTLLPLTGVLAICGYVALNPSLFLLEVLSSFLEQIRFSTLYWPSAAILIGHGVLTIVMTIPLLSYLLSRSKATKHPVSK